MGKKGEGIQGVRQAQGWGLPSLPNPTPPQLSVGAPDCSQLSFLGHRWGLGPEEANVFFLLEQKSLFSIT